MGTHECPRVPKIPSRLSRLFPAVPNCQVESQECCPQLCLDASFPHIFHHSTQVCCVCAVSTDRSRLGHRNSWRLGLVFARTRSLYMPDDCEFTAVRSRDGGRLSWQPSRRHPWPRVPTLDRARQDGCFPLQHRSTRTKRCARLAGMLAGALAAPTPPGGGGGGGTPQHCAANRRAQPFQPAQAGPGSPIIAGRPSVPCAESFAWHAVPGKAARQRLGLWGQPIVGANARHASATEHPL